MTVQILIADHDPLVRATCQRDLSARGYEAAVVGDALQCIAQLQTLSPDVLVLDPQLLWGGGTAVLSWLKEQPPLKSIQVVLADGHGNERLSADIQPLISRRLERPTGLDEMARFVNELDGVWTVSRPADRKQTPCRPWGAVHGNDAENRRDRLCRSTTPQDFRHRGEKRFGIRILDGRSHMRCNVRPLPDKDHENVCHLDSHR